MSTSGNKSRGSSRRTFLKTTAGVAAGTLLTRTTLGAQMAAGAPARFPKIDPRWMITPQQAWDWHVLKGQAGPTYAGSPGAKKFTDLLASKAQEFGGVDIDFVDVPYDRYVVDDWPDRRTHMYDSGVAVEKLVSDGTPVPVVASYAMTSGFTAPEGLTAPMVYYDPANPPTEAQIAGKILVFETPAYPAPPYNDNFLDSYTLTDYEWRSPGKWHPLFTPPPASVTSSYHSRWVWNPVGRFAAIGIKAKAAGMVIVYDLSPAAALGLLQRSVYTANGRAGVGATYINCPTLTLDRVHGAKVLTDAKAGRTANLTLLARFQRDTGRSIIARLPGRNYGTPADEQLLLAAHTDAMALIQDNGGLGLLGIMSYLNHIPQASRPRTILCYFDCRHFMPGGEGSWEQYDYLRMHPELSKSIVACMGMEHMGCRQTIETGPDGNTYTYSNERPEDGGVITSLIDVYNNNPWLIETVAKAATENHWPRVDVKCGRPDTPGLNGGFQGSVNSPMNRGSDLGVPGVGLAGDWPGAGTQTFSQIDSEAGPAGFDKEYFCQQVAGLSQIAGDLMHVKPVVIDLKWGDLKTALVKLKDAEFATPAEATGKRQTLVAEYVAAFRKVESGAYVDAQNALKQLTANVSSSVAPDKQAAVKTLIQGQMEKLATAKA